jgi:hypothetical protein
LISDVELRVCEIFYYPPAVAVACLEVVGLRGKPWSVDEERQLRQLVEEGKGSEEISKILGKTRVSIKAKLSNLCLPLKAATDKNFHHPVPATATASSPAATPPETSAPALAVAHASDSVQAAVADLKLKLPERLSTIEEMLKVLDAALAALRQPGLSSLELSRLHQIIYGAKIYNGLFAKYLNYVRLENELAEARRQLAEKNKRRSGEEDSKV